MEKTNELVKADLPVEFASTIGDEWFAAIVFTAPRSPRWKFIWKMCQKTHHLQSQKNYLVCFDETPESIKLLATVLFESLSWKTSYLFLKGVAMNKQAALQWLDCYSKSFNHVEPMLSYCLKEQDYNHFRNQFSKTVSTDRLVSFVTPCRCIAPYVTFSDSLPLSFKEQFHNMAVSHLNSLCPNYCLDNFKGPFFRENPWQGGFGITLGINIPEEQNKTKSKKRKLSLWKIICLVFILLAAIGAFSNDKEAKEEKKVLPTEQTIKH